MTCKDCIHYKICSKNDKTTDYYGKKFACGNVDDLCKYFKEKSHIIEFPCKVGDIVYETDGIRIYELTILDISLHKNKLYYETKNIDFDDDAIGKSIFLTRQEAEAKLKELKK